MNSPAEQPKGGCCCEACQQVSNRHRGRGRGVDGHMPPNFTLAISHPTAARMRCTTAFGEARAENAVLNLQKTQKTCGKRGVKLNFFCKFNIWAENAVLNLLRLRTRRARFLFLSECLRTPIDRGAHRQVLRSFEESGWRSGIGGPRCRACPPLRMQGCATLRGRAGRCQSWPDPQS